MKKIRFIDFFNEKFFAGVRNIGVATAVAGALALFFGQNLTSAILALIVGVLVLFFGSPPD